MARSHATVTNVNPRWRLRLSLAAAALVCLLIAGSFALAAILMEGALRPLLKRRASDTAALAQSIAGAVQAAASQVQIQAADGTVLDAWFLVPQHPDGRAVMVCHGVADSAFGVLGDGLLFLRHGYTVLVPESRGHGESGGFVTYGVLEADDTVRWLNWLTNHGVRETFGLGESLGGAILLESLAHGANLKAVIAECPYASFEEIAEERAGRWVRARSYPSRLAVHLILVEGLLYARLRYGVDLRAARPAEAVRGAKVPIFLIHGLADHETSAGNSSEIARENPRIVTWFPPNAGHTGAYAADPKTFEARVLAWFEQAR